MTIKHSVAVVLNKLLRPFDLHLGRLSEYPFKSLGLDAAIGRLKAKGIKPRTVIDVGASDGRWTENVRVHYPMAHYYLIEANSMHKPALTEFINSHENCAFKIAVAADKVGEIFFNQSDPFGGVASHTKSEKFNTSLPCITVDDEVAKRNLKGPFLLKLDTHGFEVPIFNGAEETLKNTNLVFVETYNFDIEKTSLRFWEMCQFLSEKGFRPIDLCEPLHRPKDGAFWQIDILFVRNDRDEFKVNSYE